VQDVDGRAPPTGQGRARDQLSLLDRPTEAEKLAAFACNASFDDLPPEAVDRLERSILDSLGCALGALDGPPIRTLLGQVERFGGNPMATVIGGGKTAPDRAAMVNTALTRYLDFMDNFLAPRETCHPSDNIGSVLAAAEVAGASGRDLLTAIAVAYEVFIRLVDRLPIMNAGFDHTTQLGISVACGVARALGLDQRRTANAIGIAASDFASLAVMRASPTSQWKGLASAAVANAATTTTFLAAEGITGALGVFEGPHGFFEVVRDERQPLDWSDSVLDAVLDTSLKRYNAEVHAQSSLETLLTLRREHGITGADVEAITIETFLTAYDIIGGGAYGDRTIVDTKEQADHSLPYLAAVALLDGDVWPEQFLPERIRRPDVQELLRRVTVRTPSHLSKPPELARRLDPFTRAYPGVMRARVTIELRDGRSVTRQQDDYEGYHSRPMTWDTVIAKFERLAERHTSAAQRRALVGAVRSLETLTTSDLVAVLSSKEVR
jgi:2-methylcitrate dehydratase